MAPTGYRTHRADPVAQVRTRRPRPGKLATNDALRTRVEEGLKAKWSPEQISARLRVDFPDDPAMRVSHETIYTSLFVQAKADLPGELTIHLRACRVRRRAQRRVFVGPRQIAEMRLLHERPPEIGERLVVGHWEGDLIVGERGLSHIGTLVEHHSRYLVLLHLPRCRTDDVIEILTARVATLPEELRGTITWDQGNEMTRHALFTLGHADLVFGGIGEEVGPTPDIGGVVVLYGTDGGLQADSPDDQFWTQDSPGVLDQGEQYDGFAWSLTGTTS